MSLNDESHWVSRNIYDAFRRSYFRMTRSCLRSHHMLVMLLHFPLQQHEESKGGPPCNSMPFGVAWAYYSEVLVSSSAAL